MAANIELKAKLTNPDSAHAVAEALSGHPPEILHQTDSFFACPDGRLKLRVLDDAHGELILYQRPDHDGPRRSNYQIAPTTAPYILLEILKKVLGYRGTVKKVRSLYLVGQTRVHIDQVEGLGEFLEIEVVLKNGQSDAEGTQIAETLAAEFAIEESDLVRVAYIDLLEPAP